MARALEIPAVVGVADALAQIRTGDIAHRRRPHAARSPSIPTRAVDPRRARSAPSSTSRSRGGLLSARHKPCVTADGVPVALKANVELPAEAILAVDHGAQGIGLYRTEFLYIDRTTQPGEDEQYEVYRAIVEAVSPQPVTLRTFDIGGDKFASTFQMPAEMNPALGLRAVRLALRQPEVFLTQLRAMVRASAHGDVRIMVPMVASVHEMREVKRLLAQATRAGASARPAVRGAHPARHDDRGARRRDHGRRLRARGRVLQPRHERPRPVRARDRSREPVARRPGLAVRPGDPAADQVRRPTRGEGATASPSRSAARWRPIRSPPASSSGLGLRELSMEAAAIPEIKEAIRRLTVAEAEAIAEQALACDSADAVEELLARELAPAPHRSPRRDRRGRAGPITRSSMPPSDER